MCRFRHLLLASVLLALSQVVFSQSVSVTPTDAQVAIKATRQFTAAVTGLSSTDVTWSAGGVVGGNVTAGTISSTGLYTAPTSLPAQNPVTVTATSKVNTKISGLVYVNILSLGPTLSTVTPNPLPEGSFTVTLKGTGFQTGASVLATGVQLVASSLTSTQIVASGYQPAATSATFSVRNPGSVASNVLTIPVTGGSTGPGSYSLTVVSGSGSGTYSAGTVVTITANPPPTGAVFEGWVGATVASAKSSSTTLTMPAANTTVTATYSGNFKLTVVNGTGSGTYASGSTVKIVANPPPTGAWFQDWTGAAVASARSASTSIVMPAVATTVTANYYTPAQIPFPVTTHPRLWVTVQDLPRLRSWAAKTNPIYENGMVPLLAQAVNIYQTQFFPNGVQNPKYPDPGDVQGYTGYLTEQYGAVLAFNSLIDPVPANRVKYAQYARNMLMVAMNQAALGHLANAPFRDPAFAIYNRANGSGEQWPLIVDWIYSATDGSGNPILTSSDKATIRKVFMEWSNDCLNASTTGGDHPVPIGAVNSLSLLPNNLPYRMASNNYYLGHARLLTMMALSIDPVDDPAIDATQPVSALGNSERSYLLNAIGAWLYQEYAMMGEAGTIAGQYGIKGSGAGFGLSSGGLPPEGMLYGHSFGFALGQLLALQTAGFNSTQYSGPQISLIGAPVWDRYVTGYFSSMSPIAQVSPSQTYLGPTFGLASYGDLLRLWVTPDVMQSFSLLALLEQENGQSAHVADARWFAVNACEGGSGYLYTRITDPWSWSSTNSILYFLLLDPTVPASPDPRPGFSTFFLDPGAGRILAHSDWTPSARMFDYRSSWESINHQDGDAGQFEFWRNGEWLTKEMSNYDVNNIGQTSPYHNTLGLQNWCPNGTPNLAWFQGPAWADGSQWNLAESAGDPVNQISHGTGYVYADSVLTPLYNLPDIWDASLAANDITQATRSILWLNNDFIVVYDRATSVHPNLFKRFNLSLITNPAIKGNVATETLPSGQELYIQTMLPASATLSSFDGAASLDSVAILEPTQYILSVEDSANPSDVRFLHVLQGANKGVAMSPADRLVSQSGTALDGTAVAGIAVYFPRVRNSTFVTTTLNLPPFVHTLYLAGLTPNASYGVTITRTATTLTALITPGGTTNAADSAGLLKATF
jgi:hypothetical protein